MILAQKIESQDFFLAVNLCESIPLFQMNHSGATPTCNFVLPIVGIGEAIDFIYSFWAEVYLNTPDCRYHDLPKLFLQGICVKLCNHGVGFDRLDDKANSSTRYKRTIEIWHPLRKLLHTNALFSQRSAPSILHILCASGGQESTSIKVVLLHNLG